MSRIFVLLLVSLACLAFAGDDHETVDDRENPGGFNVSTPSNGVVSLRNVKGQVPNADVRNFKGEVKWKKAGPYTFEAMFPVKLEAPPTKAKLKRVNVPKEKFIAVKWQNETKFRHYVVTSLPKSHPGLVLAHQVVMNNDGNTGYVRNVGAELLFINTNANGVPINMSIKVPSGVPGTIVRPALQPPFHAFQEDDVTRSIMSNGGELKGS